MNVFRHYHVTDNAKSIPTMYSLQFALEYFPRLGGVEQLHPPITTEGDEMQTALMLIAFGLGSHFQEILVLNSVPPSRKRTREGWGNPFWECPKGKHEQAGRVRRRWLQNQKPHPVTPKAGARRVGQPILRRRKAMRFRASSSPSRRWSSRCWMRGACTIPPRYGRLLRRQRGC